jgi:hypothetical protein
MADCNNLIRCKNLFSQLYSQIDAMPRPLSPLFLFALLIPFLPACKRQKAPLTTTFYYWRTTYRMDSADYALLDRFGGRPLYLRLFDVDYSGGYGDAVPVGVLSGQCMDGRPFIPVVFVTNRVFQRVDAARIDTLAKKVARKIDHYARNIALDALRAAHPDLSPYREPRKTT